MKAQLIALLGLLATLASGSLNNSACNYKMFPIFTGGSKDEDVRAVQVIPNSNLIVVAGQSTSPDFVPAANPHAFVFAVDQKGDWKWGHFFYNVSYAVSQIDGMIMSQSNTYLNCLGQANNKVVIINLNPLNGQIQKFVSLDPMNSLPKTSFSTFQGLYHEEYASDGQAYYYVTFYMSIDTARSTHFLKIHIADLEIVWHYIIHGIGSSLPNTAITPSTSTDDLPKFLSMDSIPNNNEFYIMGRFRTSLPYAAVQTAGAVVFRVNKFNGKILYKLTVNGQNDVNAFVQVNGTNMLYGCGSGVSYPGYWKIDSHGIKQFSRQLLILFGKCTGLTYDHDQGFATLLITSYNENIKSVNKGWVTPTSPTDVYLFVISDSSNIIRARQITFSSTSSHGQKNDIKLGPNALRTIGNNYIFAGYTTGFTTTLQSTQWFDPDGTTQRNNAFVMNYLLEKNQNYHCLYEGDVPVTVAITSKEEIKMEDGVGAGTTSDIAKQQNYFKLYTSPYSGAFVVLDTQYISRACAANSLNLTQMNYVYGTYAQSYDMRKESGFKARPIPVFNQMNGEVEFVFQNGSSCSALAWLNKGSSKTTTTSSNTTISVQTNDQTLVGTQRTVIRGCDTLSNLHEINLYVNVVNNDPPEFIDDIQTQWNMNVGDKINYLLPQYIIHADGDKGQVYINRMDNQPFPDFIKFINATNTLYMYPDHLKYQGYTYYFAVVLKEINSDFILTTFYMTLKVNGNIVDPLLLLPPKKTEVEVTISALTYQSQGQLTFSQEVNQTMFFTDDLNDFWNLFDVYVINTIQQSTERGLEDLPPRNREEIIDIVFTPDTNLTVNFTIQFQNPYMYGLLIMYPDTLYMVCKDVELAGLLVLNGTNQTIHIADQEINATSSIVIGIQFDYTDEKMQFYRSTAVSLYWVMIVLIVTQFFVLLFRRVGFLPLWTLIEYMQLIAFLPLYNFRLIPYLYDSFKPFLVGHLILFNNSQWFQDMNDEFFNINYQYYWLSISQLLQSLINIMILFAIMVAVHIILYIASFCCKGGKFQNFIDRQLSEFKFNAYIRFYMLAYFDFTFFSIMKIGEGNNTTTMRKTATFFSYAFFTFSIVVPIAFLAVILKQFPILSDRDSKGRSRDKKGKAKFNTLLLKIDKSGRGRDIQPFMFFIRRIITAALLCMPANHKFIFVQYMLVLMTSHVYILYLVSYRPYQTPVYNMYMIANETFYSALIIFIFIFSDATLQLPVKVTSGGGLVAAIFLLILANVLFCAYTVIKGREGLKDAITEAKIKRFEQDAKEDEEEEERQEAKRKEEDEFSRLPDDSTNISHTNISDTTHHSNTTLTEMNLNKKPSSKSFARDKLKGKDVDYVQSSDNNYTTKKTDPTYTTEKGFDPQTDEKLIPDSKKEGKKKEKEKVSDEKTKSGKVSDEKSSGSDQPKGPIME